MIQLEMKPSPRLVQQIGTIERFAGMWDRLSQSEAVASDTLFHNALRLGAQEVLRLDSTSPAGLSFLIEVNRTGSELSGSGDIEQAAINLRPLPPSVSSFIESHHEPLEFDLPGIIGAYLRITDPSRLEEFRKDVSNHASLRGYFRQTGVNFTAPASDVSPDEMVFPTLSPFLAEQRLAELVEWTSNELEVGSFHPLFIVGVFQLLFLQIHPFPSANHRLSHLLIWKLLDAHDYSFVRYSHFAPVIQKRSKQYFAALRQAERTAGGNWSSINIWLEFFLDSLIQAAEQLLTRSEHRVNNARLSGVQKKIIDVVRSNGSVTRERIVTETGINISTVKYNLSVLANRGHLRRAGGGRTTSYSLV